MIWDKLIIPSKLNYEPGSNVSQLNVYFNKYAEDRL